MKTTQRIIILGVPFNNVNETEFLHKIEEFMDKDAQHAIYTPNPEMIIESRKNKNFLDVLNQSSVSIADGVGILWAAKFLSLPCPKNSILRSIFVPFQALYSLIRGLLSRKYWKSVIKARVTGTDMFQKISKKAAQKNWTIFLLGAADGVQEKVKVILEKRYSGLRIVGTFAGSPREEDEKEIFTRINAVKPDILFVAYGARKQEMWISRNFPKMPSVKIAMGIGGAFDFVAGKQKRAPGFMRRCGLEWLCRLVHEPKRWKRIYNATFRFVFVVMLEKI